MLIILDGPEKAGKTTLARALEAQGAAVWHWGLVPDDTVYLDPLKEALSAYGARRTQHGVWDRSWASESVYAQLLGRQRRLGTDPWLGEWLYGRATPFKFMLLGPSPDTLRARRTADDLPVSPSREQAAFEQYAERFGWVVLRPAPRLRVEAQTGEYLAQIQNTINGHVTYNGAPGSATVPLDFKVLVLGDVPSTKDVPGSWLPFTSPLTTKFGRAMGDRAMQVAWSNVSAEPAPLVRSAQFIIACGSTAAHYLNTFEHLTAQVFLVPHPAWLYRWAQGATIKANTEQLVRAVLDCAHPPT